MEFQDILRGKSTWLFDVDDTLVGSENLAFAACTAVVNEVLARKSVDKQFSAPELRRRFQGLAVGQLIVELSADYGFQIQPTEIEAVTRQELDAVIASLELNVEPTPGVNQLLATLQPVKTLAAVSNSDRKRVDVCLLKAKQDDFFARDRRFSAASSLPVPRLKPNPAIHLHALATLGVDAAQAIAYEDSTSGVLAATRAGIQVIGYLGCVPEGEREAHGRGLLQAGATAVVAHWDEIAMAV